MSWAHLLYKWSFFVQTTLFPPVCLLCGARVTGRRLPLDLCPACRDDLPLNRRACARCGQPLAGGPAELCGHCLRRPPPFARVVAPLRYGHPVDRLLLGFKFHGRLAAGKVLGELAAEAFAADPGPRPELIIPVPLHADRLRERGYNQALELARPIARRLGVPVDDSICMRARSTSAQSSLTAGERRRNVKGAFTVARPLTARHVAIFDDVVSTGSTVAELARVLLRAGAERVDVWAIARAGRE